MTNPNNGLVGLWVLLPPDPDIEEYGQITAGIVIISSRLAKASSPDW